MKEINVTFELNLRVITYLHLKKKKSHTGRKLLTLNPRMYTALKTGFNQFTPLTSAEALELNGGAVIF